MSSSLLSFAPLAAFLLAAAAIDWRTRRIPNALTLAIALAGISQSVLPHAAVGPLLSLAGLAAGGALMTLLFALGAVGGGDVKLMAAVGTWLGPVGVLQVFVLEKIIGLLFVIAQCAGQRKLPALLRNSALVAVNLIHIRELGIEHVSRTGHETRTVGRRLPFAVPLLLAALALILYQQGGWR